MTKRRKPPRGVAEPLFSGYSLTSAQQRSAAPIDSEALNATPIPRTTNASQSAHVRLLERGPRPTAPGAPAAAIEQPTSRELLEFPARLMPLLPAPWTMLCEACIDGSQSVPLVVTTCAPDYATARARHYVTLHGAEFAAVTLAAELGRVTPAELERWCIKKQGDSSWELTPQVTLGVFVARHDQRALTVGQVLRACGASIVDVASAAPAPADFWEVTCG
jgi:hypothetical protein